MVCDKVKLDLLLAIYFCIDIYFSIQTHITCIVHDLGALGVIQNIQVIGSL